MNITNKEYRDNLRKLRSQLPRGYTLKLANEIGTTQQTITNALWGRTRRFDIVEKAIEMAKRGEQTAQQLKEFVNG